MWLCLQSYLGLVNLLWADGYLWVIQVEILGVTPLGVYAAHCNNKKSYIEIGNGSVVVAKKVKKTGFDGNLEGKYSA